MFYIGIDPGKNGAIAVLSGDIIVTKSIFDAEEYSFIIGKYRDLETKCCLERVSAMKGQGVTSMFSFGENYGFIKGLLTANKISFQVVTPKKWKKFFELTKDKNKSIDVCKRLFPGIDLKKTDKCRKDHDGLAEACLLAFYAKKHM